MPRSTSLAERTAPLVEPTAPAWPNDSEISSPEPLYHARAAATAEELPYVLERALTATNKQLEWSLR
jgi:hypothetical protein